MNKNIQKAFETGKAFIPFITCGDPSLDVTEQIVYAMDRAGADLIELQTRQRKVRSFRRQMCGHFPVV